MKKLLLGLAVSLATLSAGTVTYNFEDQPVIGTTTSLTDTQGGVTLTLTRQNGGAFAVSDISCCLGPSSADWGVRTLDPFQDLNADAFIFSFSAPLSAFSIQLGDFGQDSDTWSLFAYDAVGGGGTLLGTVNGNWAGGDIGTQLAQIASVSGADIFSVVAIGGSIDYPMSLYWDDVTADTGTPEPGTALLLMAGLGIVAMRFGRRH